MVRLEEEALEELGRRRAPPPPPPKSIIEAGSAPQPKPSAQPSVTQTAVSTLEKSPAEKYRITEAGGAIAPAPKTAKRPISFVVRPSAQQQVEFWTELGHPEYAGEYETFGIPTGSKVTKLTETETGLSVELTGPAEVSKTERPVAPRGFLESEALESPLEVRGRRAPIAEEQLFTYVGQPLSPSYWPTLPHMTHAPAEVADLRIVKADLGPRTPLQEWGEGAAKILAPITTPIAVAMGGFYEWIRSNVYGGAPWGSWRDTTLTGKVLDLGTPLEKPFEGPMLIPGSVLPEREVEKLIEPVETSKATVAGAVGSFESYLRPDIPTAAGTLTSGVLGVFSKEMEVASQRSAAEIRELGPGYLTGSISGEILQTVLLGKAASWVIEKTAPTRVGRAISKAIPERVKKVFTREKPVIEFAEESPETLRMMRVAEPGAVGKVTQETAEEALTSGRALKILEKMGKEIEVKAAVQKILMSTEEAGIETGAYGIAGTTMRLKGPAAEAFKGELFRYLFTETPKKAPGGVGLFIPGGTHAPGSLASMSTSASVLLQETALETALKTSLKVVTEPSVVASVVEAAAVTGAARAVSVLAQPKTVAKTREVVNPVLDVPLARETTVTRMQAWTGKPYPGMPSRVREELVYEYYTKPGEVQRLVVNTTPVVDIAQKTTPITDIALKTTPVTETVQKVRPIIETILIVKTTPITETILKTTPVLRTTQVLKTEQTVPPITITTPTPITVTPPKIVPPIAIPPPIPPLLLPVFPEDKDRGRGYAFGRGKKWTVRNPIAEPGEVADYILGKSKKGRRRQRELPITMSGEVAQHIVGLHRSPNPVRKVVKTIERLEVERDLGLRTLKRRTVRATPHARPAKKSELLKLPRMRIVTATPALRRVQKSRRPTLLGPLKVKVKGRTARARGRKEKPLKREKDKGRPIWL